MIQTITASFPTTDRQPKRQGAEKSYPEAMLVTHYSDIRKTSRPIRLVVIHCSATREDKSYTPRMLIQDHVDRGFSHAGYHFYITRDGDLYSLRPLALIGAHVRGYNEGSIGICYEGGLDCHGNAKDTRTQAQKIMMAQLLLRLRELWPKVKVCGHRDLSRDLNGDGHISRNEWTKMCPCFDARKL